MITNPEQIELLAETLKQLESGEATLEEILRRNPKAAALESLIRLSGALREERLESLPEARKQALERRLLQVMDRQTRPRAYPMRWMRVFAGMAASLVLVVGTAAIMARASGSSIPGDTLYGYKRAVEQIELAFAGASRPQQLAHIAQARIEEVKLLALEQRPLEERFLSDFTEAVNAAILAQTSQLAGAALYQGARSALQFAVSQSPSRIGAIEGTLKALIPPVEGAPESVTITATATITSTATMTASASPTVTPTHTLTPTLTVSSTSTPNPTVTAPYSATLLVIEPATLTPTYTASSSPTGQPTTFASLTFTPTWTPSWLPSALPTSTSMPIVGTALAVTTTPPPLPSPLPTDTPAPIETAQPTHTPTFTPTGTPTATPTETPIVGTPTHTPTLPPCDPLQPPPLDGGSPPEGTLTPTPTPTPCASLTPTLPPLATLTPTLTETLMPETLTPTPTVSE